MLPVLADREDEAVGVADVRELARPVRRRVHQRVSHHHRRARPSCGLGVVVLREPEHRGAHLVERPPHVEPGPDVIDGQDGEGRPARGRDHVADAVGRAVGDPQWCRPWDPRERLDLPGKRDDEVTGPPEHGLARLIDTHPCSRPARLTVSLARASASVSVPNTGNGVTIIGRPRPQPPGRRVASRGPAALGQCGPGHPAALVISRRPGSSTQTGCWTTRWSRPDSRP